MTDDGAGGRGEKIKTLWGRESGKWGISHGAKTPSHGKDGKRTL